MYYNVDNIDEMYPDKSFYYYKQGQLRVSIIIYGISRRKKERKYNIHIKLKIF